MTFLLDRPTRIAVTALTGRAAYHYHLSHMPLFRAGQLRKRWHYVSFWSRELSFCAARASVGPLQQEYWGIWDREAKQFREGSHRFTRRVQLEPNRVQVRDDDVEIAVTFEPCTSFEVYRPAGELISGRTRIIADRRAGDCALRREGRVPWLE